MTPFSFVDRITAIEPGVMARGTFTVPHAVARFPVCLTAEAVGQLAAWPVMAHANFQARPVAGLARAVTLTGSAAAGTAIELAAEIHRCERDVVLYSGWARVDDVTIVELRRCVGPLLPMADFDDPESVRERYQRLCREGVVSREWSGSQDWDLTPIHCDRKPGESLSAEVAVPETCSFFRDHFPRKPVLPATLLLDAKVRLATELARDAIGRSPEARITPVRVRDVKVRAFTPPGQRLTLSAQVMAVRSTSADIAVCARMGSKQVATARVELVVA